MPRRTVWKGSNMQHVSALTLQIMVVMRLLHTTLDRRRGTRSRNMS